MNAVNIIFDSRSTAVAMLRVFNRKTQRVPPGFTSVGLQVGESLVSSFRERSGPRSSVESRGEAIERFSEPICSRRAEDGAGAGGRTEGKDLVCSCDPHPATPMSCSRSPTSPALGSEGKVVRMVLSLARWVLRRSMDRDDGRTFLWVSLFDQEKSNIQNFKRRRRTIFDLRHRSTSLSSLQKDDGTGLDLGHRARSFCPRPDSFLQHSDPDQYAPLWQVVSDETWGTERELESAGSVKKDFLLPGLDIEIQRPPRESTSS